VLNAFPSQQATIARLPHLFHYIPVFYGLFELILSQFCHSRYSGKARVLI